MLWHSSRFISFVKSQGAAQSAHMTAARRVQSGKNHDIYQTDAACRKGLLTYFITGTEDKAPLQYSMAEARHRDPPFHRNSR